MNAVVSGRAGIAFLFQGEDAFYIRLRSGTAAIPCRMEDFPFLFGDARDLRFLEEVAVSDAEALLRDEVAKAQSLQIMLILLDGTDGGYPPTVRSSAARELEDLLADGGLEEYLSRVLFSHPLSQDGDLSGAFAYVPRGLLRLRALLEELYLHQAYISMVCRAWETIPTATFGNLRERALAKTRMAQSGGFRDLANARAHGGAIDPSLAQRWPFDLRGLFDEWIKAMRPDLRGPWPMILDGAGRLEAGEQRASFVAEVDLDPDGEK